MQKVKRNVQFEKTVVDTVKAGRKKDSTNNGPFEIPKPFDTLDAFLGDEKKEGVVHRMKYPETGETITVISKKVAGS